MIDYVQKYRGIHPGKLLAQEIEKRSITKKSLALAVGEYPQNLNDIFQGRKGISVALALKIEQELGFEEGTFVFLQSYYDIKKIKAKSKSRKPDLTLFRKSLFSDIDMETIAWELDYEFIIKRIYREGNTDEKNAISNFYGQSKIKSILFNLQLDDVKI